MSEKLELKNTLTEKIESISDKLHDLDKSLAIVKHQLVDHLSHSDKNFTVVTHQLVHIEKHLGEYGKQLAIHIQGVQEAHRRNEILSDTLNLTKIDFELRLKTVEKPIIIVQGMKWLLGAGVLLTAILQYFFR